MNIQIEYSFLPSLPPLGGATGGADSQTCCRGLGALGTLSEGLPPGHVVISGFNGLQNGVILRHFRVNEHSWLSLFW